jgi:hypothetical protein
MSRLGSAHYQDWVDTKDRARRLIANANVEAIRSHFAKHIRRLQVYRQRPELATGRQHSQLRRISGKFLSVAADTRRS